MKKATRKTPKRSEKTKESAKDQAKQAGTAPPSLVQSPIHAVIEDFHERRLALREQARAVDEAVKASREAGEIDVQLSSHQAFQAEKFTRLMTESRQIDKHLRDSAALMTPEEVDDLTVYHILEMTPPGRRDAIIERLNEAVAAESSRGLLS